MARHLTYTYQPRDSCTGAAVGPPVTVTDRPCDAACYAAGGAVVLPGPDPQPVPASGPGLYFVTRLFNTDTCTFDAPVCQKAPPCPLADCP